MKNKHPQLLQVIETHTYMPYATSTEKVILESTDLKYCEDFIQERANMNKLIDIADQFKYRIIEGK